MLMCRSQRASESVLVDFVTREGESASLPFPPQEKKNIEKLRNPLDINSISKACVRIRNDRIINSAYN